ncbi:carboxylic acid transporter [Talaromyces proteolyticus]|uniref:Carboxylic acid transporter n=1 Tax=Talaromyces proteolyticus TaxID=1131652 RepID=A0AAD4Q308_9EURO|nr:carboxylic acid transporter [Talaromyces proteolyticus]KAH8700913.1 carboxylic acid transporter [Talaromyces proteolyticus]
MKNFMENGWFYSRRQILHYLKTRPSSLKPPKTKLDNPIHVLGQLNRHQWLMFSCGFIAWVWDAFDYFSVSLTLTDIANDFGVDYSDVSWGMTITLMLRSVDALIFGTIADRYGRKWPMIINLCFFIVLELASGFCQNLSQFLAVRSLYGIAMGGMFGPAASTALEELPYDARGILSGLFQNGYSTGYLLVAIFYRALVPTTRHGWRSLFWFASGPPIFIIAFRLWLPETNHFQVLQGERKARVELLNLSTNEDIVSSSPRKRKEMIVFLKDAAKSVGENWVLLIYMVILMTGFNSCSHGSQDFYPTYLKAQVGLGPTDVTVISVVGQIGSICGGTVIGFVSTFSGRRLAMLTACVFGGSLVPAYIIPRNMGLVASAFFEQFFVGGVWGPIPIHLMELAPPYLRTTVIGLTYQLGNLASSASATIQAVIGERFPLPLSSTGEKTFDYGKVIAIFMGAVWVYVFIFLFLGPEMSQEEREQETEAVRDLEAKRREGADLAQIGADLAGGGNKDMFSIQVHLENVTVAVGEI